MVVTRELNVKAHAKKKQNHTTRFRLHRRTLNNSVCRARLSLSTRPTDLKVRHRVVVLLLHPETAQCCRVLPRPVPQKALSLHTRCVRTKPCVELGYGQTMGRFNSAAGKSCGSVKRLKTPGKIHTHIHVYIYIYIQTKMCVSQM